MNSETTKYSPTAEHSEAVIYSEITNSVQVTVEPEFLEEQSEPEDHQFVWAYHIRIENQGRETLTLLTRYWRIIDSLGRTQEVRGAGVVGEQPVLAPGEAFEYTSGTPLGTPSGLMVGSYEMESETGERFDVAVPAFSLDSPHQPSLLH